VKFIPDRKMIEGIRQMPDDKLWHAACILFSQFAADGRRKNPDPRKIRGIRRVLDAITDEDIQRLGEMAEIYYNTAPRDEERREWS